MPCLLAFYHWFSFSDPGSTATDARSFPAYVRPDCRSHRWNDEANRRARKEHHRSDDTGRSGAWTVDAEHPNVRVVSYCFVILRASCSLNCLHPVRNCCDAQLGIALVALLLPWMTICWRGARGGGVSSVWGCGLSRNFLYIIHTRCRLDVVSNYSSSLLLLYLFYLTNYLLLERKVLSHCGTWNKRAVMRLKMSVVWFQAFLLSVWEVISCKSPGLVKSA